jgi:hypothetical protein
MNVLSRRLHEIKKTSIITEPEEACLLIEDQKELELHRTAVQILERHKRDIEDCMNNLEGPACPTLSESEQEAVCITNLG